MLPLMIAVALVYLGTGETPRVPWLVLLLTVGAIFIPVLWAKQFYLSPTMCLLYALSLAVWINGGRKRATIVFVSWLAVFLVLGALLQKSYGEYAHVYQLFLCKLRFLGVKPGDPAALPWEARVLWEGAFNTAGWGEFWRSLMACGPLALVCLVLNIRSEDSRMNVEMRIFLLFALLLAPLAWMVVRYFTFLGFAVAIVAAGLVTGRIWWKLAVIVAAVGQLAMLNLQPLERQQPSPNEYRPIVQWLQENTPTNAVLLATISESPVFLAHTGRPIIMHSKFENQRIRERYREMLDAIYGSEKQFFTFARKYGADYFVYDVGFLYNGSDSRRYKANQMKPLDPNCAAMLFEKQPQQLEHFKLEISNVRFAIFHVLASPTNVSARAFLLPLDVNSANHTAS